jgi:deazaflavin-dependent oxidoreductase (nitroreductase family)
MSVLPDAHARARLCFLTTTGRVSGNPHEVEIWFAADGDTAFILSGGGDRSDWVRNIRRNSDCRIRIGESVYHGSGRLVAPDEPLDGRAREIVARKYGEVTRSGELSEWARTSLVVAIELKGLDGSAA